MLRDECAKLISDESDVEDAFCALYVEDRKPFAVEIVPHLRVSNSNQRSFYVVVVTPGRLPTGRSSDWYFTIPFDVLLDTRGHVLAALLGAFRATDLGALLTDADTVYFAGEKAPIWGPNV
jgi:hypothetical protein